MIKYIFFILLLVPSVSFAYSEREHPLVCAVAEYRLHEIQSDFSHAQFFTGKAWKESYDRLGHTWANYLPNGVVRENLARGFTKREDVFTAWNKSPTHHANLIASSTYSCLRSANGHWVLITYAPIVK